MLVYFVFVLWFSWIFVNASWFSESCVSGNKDICDVLPNEPYCVSDKVDNTHCNWLWLTNTWSLETVDNVGTIIEHYCKNSLWSGKNNWRIYFAKPSVVSDYDWWDWQQTFDSNQSLFVYALCSSFQNDSGRPFLSGWSSLLSGVFQWEDIVKILKLQQLVDWNDNCSLGSESALNKCDMSLYATEIFSSIMSEIFKIWYAQIFNVNTVKEFETKQSERVVSFLSWYYGITQDFDKVNNRFPQTIDILKWDQLFYKKVLDKLKLINNSELANMVEDGSSCPDTWDIRWLQYLACALHGSQWNGVALSRSFLTLCYNELLNYRVFVAYYTNMLRRMASAEKENTDKLVFEAQALNLENYSSMQVSAFEETLSDMEDVSMTYPLHIWLLLYQERLKNFRNRYLSPVVTMFYSLSEKLQNVQIPADS